MGTAAVLTPTRAPRLRHRHTADWAHEVGTVLQHLAGRLYGAEREGVEAAFRRLAIALPPPFDPLEALWLREKLANVSSRAVASWHEQYHRSLGSHCDWVIPRPLSSIWDVLRKSERFLIRVWTHRCFTAFDAQHPEVGVPVAVARILRAAPHRPIRMTEVARRAGCSRSVMERAFQHRYGLTPKIFHTRVRLRAASRALRAGVKLESVARTAGYPGGNFYRAFEMKMGTTPSELRAMGPDAFERLLDARVAVDLVRLRDERVLGEALGGSGMVEPTTPGEIRSAVRRP